MLYKPAPQTHLLLIDAEGVVFSQHQQALFALNTTACFIWIHMEKGQTMTMLAEALCNTFSLAPDQGLRMVRDIMMQWCRLGLVTAPGAAVNTGVDIPAKPVLPRAAPCPVADMEPAIREQRVYRLLNSSIRIRYSSRQQYLWVHPILAHLQKNGPDEPAETVISIMRHNGQYYLLNNGDCIGTARALRFLGAQVKAMVLQTAINNYDYLAFFHAGVVANNNTCTLFPAASGSGKSTLTAALLRHGYAYLSDEVALIRDGSCCVVPVPVSIGLKAGSWKLLATYYPSLSGRRTHDREDGKKVRYLPPPQRALCYEDDACLPVRNIIFPHYTPSTHSSITPLARVSALKRLFDECMVIPGELTLRQVENMAAWIRSVECYTLNMQSLHQAVDLVNRTLNP